MVRYEYDSKSVRFRKVRKSFWGKVRSVVGFLLASMSITVVIYVVASFFLLTDTERQLRRENRMYERLYPELLEKQKLVSDVVKDLESRDNAIYREIFNADAPEVDPVSSIETMFTSDTLGKDDLIGYTSSKATELSAIAGEVEDNFLTIFSKLAEDGYKLPPMSAPLEEVGYASTGASVGQKVSPFYKVQIPHTGIDLVAQQGDPVLATADGTVREVERSGKGMGNTVLIDHGNGYMTKYCHLADIKVYKGQKVKKGAKIATVGMTGSSFAPHLHYEVLLDGEPKDPLGYMFGSVDIAQYAAMAFMTASTGQSLE